MRIALYHHVSEQTDRNINSLLDDIQMTQRATPQTFPFRPFPGGASLNFCSIGTDFLDYTVDRSPHKYGTWTPGSRIPIYHPDHIGETRPDYLFVLPWNLIEEILEQTAFIKTWGGKWVTPIPSLEVHG